MKYAIYGDSNTTAAFEPRTARAFCEGRKANADGAAIGTNPFTIAKERENYAAWAAGHAAYTADSTAKEYCAV